MGDLSFEEAACLLPPVLQNALLRLQNDLQAKTFEIRLRADRPVVLFGSFGSTMLSKNGALCRSNSNDLLLCPQPLLEETFLRLCDYSIHAHMVDLIQGFVTAKGGHRVGVAGTAVTDDGGKATAVREITSLNLRVARTVRGVCDPLLPLLQETDGGILLAGAPASGKTTILRDLIERLSSFQLSPCPKLCVIDERRELDAGKTAVNCDYLRGFSKAQAILNALKTLSPEWIVCDELASEQDLEAVLRGVNSGVRFVSTVHASSVDELKKRKIVRRLLETGAFRRIVLLQGAASPGRIRQIIRPAEIGDA